MEDDLHLKLGERIVIRGEGRVGVLTYDPHASRIYVQRGDGSVFPVKQNRYLGHVRDFLVV